MIKTQKCFSYKYMHRNHIQVISFKTISCLQVKWLKEVQLINLQRGNIFIISLYHIKGMQN